MPGHDLASPQCCSASGATTGTAFPRAFHHCHRCSLRAGNWFFISGQRHQALVRGAMGHPYHGVALGTWSPCPQELLLTHHLPRAHPWGQAGRMSPSPQPGPLPSGAGSAAHPWLPKGKPTLPAPKVVVWSAAKHPYFLHAGTCLVPRGGSREVSSPGKPTPPPSPPTYRGAGVPRLRSTAGRAWLPWGCPAGWGAEGTFPQCFG